MDISLNQSQQSIKKWSEEEIERLRSLVSSQLTMVEICKALDRNRGSVRDRLAKLGLKVLSKASTSPGNIYTENQWSEAASLWNEGLLTSSQISKITGIHSETLRKTMSLRRDLFVKRGTTKAVKYEAPPEPETTEIQYEYNEIPPPEGALSKPFYLTGNYECQWILASFWEETKYDSPCCALPIVEKNGKGLRKRYCQYHFDASLRKE